MGTEKMWTFWCVLKEGDNVVFCPNVAKSALTHFITSLFLSFIFFFLFLYALFWRSVTGKPPDIFVFISSFYLFMAWPHQQHSWSKCICHTNSASLIYLILFFHGSLFKKEGEKKTQLIQNILVGLRTGSANEWWSLQPLDMLEKWKSAESGVINPSHFA